MAEAKKPLDVTILSRDEITTFPKIGQAVIQVQVTYVAAGLPPATLFIPKNEYSLEFEKKQIKKDVQDRLKKQPESYQV